MPRNHENAIIVGIIFQDCKWMLIPVILFGKVFIWFLYDDLNEMHIPVIAYALVILTMLGSAINR